MVGDNSLDANALRPISTPKNTPATMPIPTPAL